MYTGATPHGQSHKTMLAQIAADQLGVDYEDITVVTGDTAQHRLRHGHIRGAHRGQRRLVGAYRGASKLAKKLKQIAAEMLQVAAGRHRAQQRLRASCAAQPEKRKHFRELAFRAAGMPGVSMAGGLTPGLEHTAYFTPDQSTYSNGTHVAEVEVDIETGGVEILRYIVMHDCGNVINPMVVKGQVEGGVAHGVGNALFERMIYDDNAQPVNVNFGEYLLPGSTDVPHVELHHMETPSPLNPIGVKGAGEGGTIPAIAAIIAAIENALPPFGVKISKSPVSPSHLVGLIRNAEISRPRRSRPPIIHERMSRRADARLMDIPSPRIAMRCAPGNNTSGRSVVAKIQAVGTPLKSVQHMRSKSNSLQVL